MNLKKAFALRLAKGERMTELCREFGISRETGYEVKRKFATGGEDALEALSHAPHRIPHKTPEPLADLLVQTRLAHPTWGGKKLKEVLEEQHGVKLPAPSTITEILQRRGVIKKSEGRRRVFPPALTPRLREATLPNVLWCADFKGQFRMLDGNLCYPLTMTDQVTRYLLCCEGMSAIRDEAACDVSLSVFEKYGLPDAIRTDNGIPFASTGLAGLTRLSVLWLRLGIELERIEPGKPQQNGRHERMHRTLKQETTRPPGQNLLQQQERFDLFQEEFNTLRPHEALGQKPPNSVYRPSARKLPSKLPEPSYPLHDDTLFVTSDGRISFNHYRQRCSVHVSAALAHQPVGIREEDDGRWLVTFMSMDLGHIDTTDKRFTPAGALA